MSVLLWLDQDPHRHWLVAYILLYATTGLALTPIIVARALGLLGRGPMSAALMVLGALTLFAFHWPSYFWEWPSNPDEAQMLAQAIKFTHSPIPWSAYDPTTSGPLNTAVLALPALFGVTPGYISARIEATVLVLGSLVFFFLALRSLFDERVARVSILPVFFFFALCESTDFNGYSSELMPLFLVMFVALCVSKARSARASRLNALALLAGVTIGAVPFAKLQLAPIALVETLILVWILRSRTDAGTGVTRRAFARLAAGIFVVPACILVPVAAAGAFDDFLISYVFTPLERLGRRTNPFPALFAGAPDFRAYFVASCAALAACLAALFAVVDPRTLDARRRATIAASLALFAVALYTIYQPHRDFPHYLLIAAFPLAGCAGVALGTLLEALPARIAAASTSGAVAALCLGFVIATCVPTVVASATEHNFYVGRLRQALADRNGDIPRLVVARVEPGSSVAVWGWMAQYYVVTKTTMATRDSITQFQIPKNRRQAYYRARYMHDIQISNPRYFIDAVAPGSFAFKNPKTQGYEIFGALARYVAANYQLVSASQGIRLFERKDAGPTSGLRRDAGPL